MNYFFYCLISISLWLQPYGYVIPELGWYGKKEQLQPEGHTTSAPYISGNTFWSIADWHYDETRQPLDPAKVQKGDIIFVNGDYLESFFNDVHPKITQQYILLTHNSIVSVPGPYAHHLNDTTLAAWFGKNADISQHRKMHGLPLGVANNYWPHGNTQLITEAIKRAHNNPTKPYFLYSNFASKTHETRPQLLKFFQKQSYVHSSRKKPFAEYLNDLALSRCVLSPEGTSVDCHRTWETFLMGSIPVVQHSIIDHLFEKLPVILVSDFLDITQEFLEKKLTEIYHISFEKERAYADYWINKIKAVQTTLRAYPMTIPNNFGVDFTQSMQITHRYNAYQASQNDDWCLAEDLYTTYCNNLEQFYRDEPRIPKIIHHIWIGGKPMPQKQEALVATWRKQHPDWHHRLWTDADVPMFVDLGLINQNVYNSCANIGERADILRYAILYLFGGLYVDTDFECYQRFDFLHHTCDFFAGTNFDSSFFDCYIGIIGCKPKSSILYACVQGLQKNLQQHQSSLQKTGPNYFTRRLVETLKTCNDVCVLFPVTYFYPWPHFERLKGPKDIKHWIKPETMAIHHWHVSWMRS